MLLLPERRSLAVPWPARWLALWQTINGAWAEYLLVPDARANLAVIPGGLTDEQVLMLPASRSTWHLGANGGVRTGDSVAVFAQGPGICARRSAPGCVAPPDCRRRSHAGAARDVHAIRRFGHDRSPMRATSSKSWKRLTEGAGRGCRHRSARAAGDVRSALRSDLAGRSCCRDCWCLLTASWSPTTSAI